MKESRSVQSHGEITIVNITERATVRRLPQRGAYDEETVHAILDAGFLAHIGFCVEGQPFVIPMLYGRAGNTLFLHGSAASRLMRQLQHGVAVCATVTIVDGLVLARSAFHHSMNYRSVVAFGTAQKIDDDAAKREALRTISEHLIAHRWADVRPPNGQELKATTVLALAIEEASAKQRTGGPLDDEQDYALDVWAGVLPVQLTAGAPVPDERMSRATIVPDYIDNFARARGRRMGIPEHEPQPGE
jgi:nitroimidazol reductase NimA-like FMN-containing flavoprotein (pyridoxamine 5'-phosphate oxidase superfamily)